MNFMEDTNKREKIIKIIVVSITILVILTTGVQIYKELVDTPKFKKYINNNYETDDKSDIYYTVYNGKNILTKTIKIDNNLNSKVILSLNKKNEIKGKLELFGTNKYGSEGMLYLESTYKNKKFDCKIISNNGYKTRCDILKKHTIDFEKEIKEILKKLKTNIKYINPNTKIATN